MMSKHSVLHTWGLPDAAFWHSQSEDLCCVVVAKCEDLVVKGYMFHRVYPQHVHWETFIDRNYLLDAWFTECRPLSQGDE